MRDIAATLRAWSAAGRPYALASLVAVSGSAPRPLGAAMAVDGDGAVCGGVSGGCIEGAVYTRCGDVLASGEAVVESFGYSDADAFAVGLTCGGTMDVLIVRVEPDDPAIGAAVTAVLAGEPVTLVRAVAGADLGAAAALTPHGTAGNPDLLAEALRDGTEDPAAPALPDASGRVGRLAVEVHNPPPRLLVYGAVDFAAPLVTLAKALNFTVVVCDARAVFATPARFPGADAVLVDWPHRHFDAATVDEHTAVCVLTHDEKFDLPLLERALVSDAGYIGALGSRATHRDRLARLRDAGLDDTALARLRSPIGLDLNGRSAEETALAVIAEIVAARNGAHAGFLTEAQGPLHY